MSHLVRARVKAIDQTPDWFRCCKTPDEPGWFQPLEEFDVDMSTVRNGGEGKCNLCGAVQPQQRIVDAFQGDEEFVVSLELIDLDEGAM